MIANHVIVSMNFVLINHNLNPIGLANLYTGMDHKFLAIVTRLSLFPTKLLAHKTSS